MFRVACVSYYSYAMYCVAYPWHISARDITQILLNLVLSEAGFSPFSLDGNNLADRNPSRFAAIRFHWQSLYITGTDVLLTEQL